MAAGWPYPQAAAAEDCAAAAAVVVVAAAALLTIFEKTLISVGCGHALQLERGHS